MQFWSNFVFLSFDFSAKFLRNLELSFLKILAKKPGTLHHENGESQIVYTYFKKVLLPFRPGLHERHSGFFCKIFEKLSSNIRKNSIKKSKNSKIRNLTKIVLGQNGVFVKK